MKFISVKQNELVFPTDSVINIEKLGTQNKKLYEWLSVQGNTIHIAHPKKQEFNIGYLNSRIADLKKLGVAIHKRFIKINNTSIREYSMFQFDDSLTTLNNKNENTTI